MKKIITYLAGILITSSVAAAPTSKVLEEFKRTFPNAENIKWSDGSDGYSVSFYSHQYFEKVLYSKEGNFVCSWKYTDGKELPTNIVILLNKKFGGDIKMEGVTEFTAPESTEYDIKFTKGSKLYQIDVSPDGNITKEQKYTNQNTNE
jgi:hypothetical protein